jgi:hypothetical protein
MRNKVYRTAPFHGPDTDPGGQPTLWYWTYETFGDNPQQGLIRAQEVATSFQMGSLVSPALSAAEGIEKLIELEKAAHADPDMRPANDRDYETFKQLGHQYHDTLPYQQHPAYVLKQHQERLKAHAKAAKPMKLQARQKGPAPK